MKKIKKLLLLIFSLTFTVFLSVSVLALNKISSSANTGGKTNTTMFMPASRLEFYDLNSPQAICFSDGYMVISEYHKNELGVQTNKLIVYNPTNDTYEVNLSEKLVNVTCVAKYENYLLLLIDSTIFTLDLNNVTADPIDTSIRVGKSFSVNKNVVATNTSSGIYKYNVSLDNEAKGGIKFTQFDYNYVTGVLSCLLTDNGDFYYFVSGTGLIRRDTYKAETIIYKSVPELDITPSHMAELGNYIYFTTPSGLYKVEKKENAELIKVIPVSNDGGLGSLSSPSGITVKDGKLLVADTTLNCIQEIDPNSDAFTEFAITTESTADYRLTNNAESLSVSDNYIYAIDNATISNGETEPIKRLVKISLDSTKKSYEKFDLTSVYNEYGNITSIKYAASDTHVMLAINNKVALYKQVEGKPITLTKIAEYNNSARTLYYLDNDFYFTSDYIDVYNANASYVQLYKVTLPTTDNELASPVLSNISANIDGETFSKAIYGSSFDLTVDIFGNVYVAVSYEELEEGNDTPTTKYKLYRCYGNSVVASNEFTFKPLGIETDFAGNVYTLTENNLVKKFNYSTEVTIENFTINSVNDYPLKDIALNYRSENAYFLSNACILTTTDKNLNIQNLLRVSADSVNSTLLQTNPTFITVDKNAKLFKVTIGDYIEENGKKYFKTIESISNPNTERIYLIIADIDDDYYLISYSNKFTALVKKSSVQINSSTSIVPPENYSALGITVEDLLNDSYYITNNVNYFSRPIFDDNYIIGSVQENNSVLASKKVAFNGKTFILISNANGEYLGYVPEGYLVKSYPTKVETEVKNNDTVYGNGEKRTKNVLMVMIIAFTLTALALILEHKLLFKKPE